MLNIREEDNMPIFNFECVECGKQEEKLVKNSEVLEVLCGCDKMSPMNKTNKVFNLNFSLKGNWFKNNQKY